MGDSTSCTTLSPLIVLLRDTLAHLPPGVLSLVARGLGVFSFGVVELGVVGLGAPGEVGCEGRGAPGVEEKAELDPLDEMWRRGGGALVLFRSASAAASKNFIRSLRLIVEGGSVRLDIITSN